MTIDVPPIHCALCRAALVRAVEQTGAVVIGAALGASCLVVDVGEGARTEAVLDAVRAVVVSVAHPATSTGPTTATT